MIKRLGMRGLAQLAHHLHDVHPTARAEDAIDAGNLRSHLGAVSLREAASSDQHLARALRLRELMQYIQ
jgi:hypothetical protein